MIKEIQKILKHGPSKTKSGYALYTAIILTSLLVVVAYATANLSIKELQLSTSASDSHLAFYNADSGAECALYWDVKNSQASSFSTGAVASWSEVHIVEYSNVDTNSPLDQASASTSVASGINNQNYDSGSRTTQFSNELIFGYSDQWVSSGSVTQGAGFTKRSSAFTDMIEDEVVASTGNYSAPFILKNPNHHAGDNMVALMASFKAAPSKTPTFIQETSQSGSNSVTFNSPSNTGDLIVVSFQYNTTDFNINSVTDDKGNLYTQAITSVGYLSNGSGNPKTSAEIWYAKNINGGGGPLTITAHSPAFVPQTINCNNQTISTGSQTVQTNPTQLSQIGGGGLGNPVSIFQLNFTSGCAIVSITKNPDGTTLIQSRGYNKCSGSNRLERGIKIQY